MYILQYSKIKSIEAIHINGNKTPSKGVSTATIASNNVGDVADSMHSPETFTPPASALRKKFKIIIPPLGLVVFLGSCFDLLVVS